ncbi:hypothetical protein B8V81_3374 [Paenibacillus pasadenensis]|uniref:Uncharacterized protein n=1 Tax=Paenibacillus pasadenensis TaxID=217090 RepID=A0A2N5N3M9_9BACL|nr:hypothetical protein B8V81_3374 [Paenibacillus pasadenensis]
MRPALTAPKRASPLSLGNEFAFNTNYKYLEIKFNKFI